MPRHDPSTRPVLFPSSLPSPRSVPRGRHSQLKAAASSKPPLAIVIDRFVADVEPLVVHPAEVRLRHAGEVADLAYEVAPPLADTGDAAREGGTSGAATGSPGLRRAERGSGPNRSFCGSICST